MDDEMKQFFGCYLLYCKNPAFLGRTYIGFTVNPNRRINQHNNGKEKGGAWKTSGKGPWEMALIIHGFPNMISALRFEWAWQHPEKSRRLHRVQKKKKNESAFSYRFRIMSEMLRTGPWNRLPLIIRWLKQEYKLDFDSNLIPPFHMPIVYGPVSNVKHKPASDKQTKLDNKIPNVICHLCHSEVNNEQESLQCPVKNCYLVCHSICLSQHFLSNSDEFIIPVSGTCPKCQSNLTWGDLICFKNGCFVTKENEVSNQEHWTDALSQM